MRLEDKDITTPLTSTELRDSCRQNVTDLAETFCEKQKIKANHTYRILRFLMPEKSTLVILVMLFRFKSLQRETWSQELDFDLNSGHHICEPAHTHSQKCTSVPTVKTLGKFCTCSNVDTLLLWIIEIYPAKKTKWDETFFFPSSEIKCLLYFLAVIQSVLTEAVRYMHVSRPCVHSLIPLIRVCCLLKRCRGGGTGARTKEIREHGQTTNFSLLFHTRLSWATL